MIRYPEDRYEYWVCDAHKSDSTRYGEVLSVSEGPLGPVRQRQNDYLLKQVLDHPEFEIRAVPASWGHWNVEQPSSHILPMRKYAHQ